MGKKLPPLSLKMDAVNKYLPPEMPVDDKRTILLKALEYYMANVYVSEVDNSPRLKPGDSSFGEHCG